MIWIDISYKSWLNKKYNKLEKKIEYEKCTNHWIKENVSYNKILLEYNICSTIRLL